MMKRPSVKKRLFILYLLGVLTGAVLVALVFSVITIVSKTTTDTASENKTDAVSVLSVGENPLVRLSEQETDEPSDTLKEQPLPDTEEAAGDEAGSESIDDTETDEPESEDRILFIGDSRTIDMFADSDDELIEMQSDGIVIYARHGFGYDYMVETVTNYGADNFDVLVTWMGANDHGDFSRYNNFYNELLSKGKKIIVCTVGPTQDDNLAEWDHPDYENSNMIKYNTALQKWAADNGVKVIDLYSYISSNVQIDPADGIHYTPRPTTSIWEYICNNIG
ncbi:MAG: SGNH/GDSL hydrolase family protein [Lachnospiraceae bacterium]|nr:SGNH/GDSL hydrolase family protein [Lachnospiraceae bacterium]